jgi:flagellar biosynthesis/type III secretory pathway protein FliH
MRNVMRDSNPETLQARYTPPTDLYSHASEKAFLLLREAEIAAEKIISHTRKVAAKQIFKAYKRSKAIGYKRGKKEVLNEQALHLTKQLSDLASYTSTLKEDCFLTTLSVIKEILQVEVSQSSESIRARLCNALSAITDKQHLKILVNPKDLARLKTSSPQLESFLISDEKVELGNGIIKTPIGKIELTWEEHYDLIFQILLARISEQ